MAMMDANRGVENARIAALMLSGDSLADQFLEQADRQGANALLSRSGVTARLQKQLAECILSAELKHHLQTLGKDAQWGNYRNGSTPKNVFTPSGVLELAIPRVRFATFEPRLIPRYQRRLPGFDDAILAVFANGLGPAAVRAHLQTLYAEQDWLDLADTVTEEVLALIARWQTRELEYASAALHVGTLHVPSRSPAGNGDLAVSFALALLCDGNKDVFGFWVDPVGSASLAQRMLLDLRQRGLSNVGLIGGSRMPGLQEAAETLYPAASFIHTRRY